MAQTLNFKSSIGGVMAVTPSAIFKGLDTNIAAGANVAATLPQAGPCLVVATMNFKAVGSACVTLAPVFATNSALTGTPTYGCSLNTVNLPLANTVVTLAAVNYLATGAFFGLWQVGTLTGTYTIDYQFEWYPLL
jgi:hypothetical protein